MDEITFTLHSPLTEEEWDMITDVDLDHTLEITFHTKHGKEVVFVKRKTGEWIERNPQNSDKCRLIECDKCGFSHIVGFNVPYEHWIENRNFCERCGADMRGEGDD